MMITRSKSSTTQEQAKRDSASAPVAEVTDLVLDFYRKDSIVHALRGVSLTVERGEIVALVGESGSGKSALSLAMLGLLPKRLAGLEGAVRICGTDMLGGKQDERRTARKHYLGAVFQDPMTSLNPTMRVGQQLVEATGSSPEAVRLLELVGVPDPQGRLRAYPHQLSGGLRQRVMIAMAVAGNPPLVIADEPTTALDVTVQAQILTLIQRLRDELGTSFLLITHDLGVAASVADRLLVMYGGRVVESGPIESLAVPKHPYTRGLLEARLNADQYKAGQLLSLPGESLDARSTVTGCGFADRCVLVKAECRAAVPPLIAVGPSHTSACIRAFEVVDMPSGRFAATSGVVATAPIGPGERVAGPILQISNARRSFSVGRGRKRKSLQALRGIDLSLSDGEALAIVGESGSGKTTLLRAAASLESLDSGTIDLRTDAEAQMVFQDAGASLTPWLTVGELLEDRLRVRKVSGSDRAERVAAALRTVGLPPETAAARASQLSGGQRQRVVLARTVIVPPALLLCDEPTSALDASLAAMVLNLLAGLRSSYEMAMMFVTHDLGVARAIADRVAVMYLGEIVETGTVDEVVSDPLHPYTRALVASVPVAGRAPRVLEGEPANPLNVPAGCSFSPRCPYVISDCLETRPILSRVPDQSGRSARCLRLDEIARAPRPVEEAKRGH
jgi:peptide/nickel transport system ATP-binding protein